MAAPTVKVGDKIPATDFSLIAYTPELEDLVSHFDHQKLIGKGIETFYLGDSTFVVFVSVSKLRHAIATDLRCAATKLNTDEWKGKKVVLFAVPGAFTVCIFMVFNGSEQTLNPPAVIAYLSC
jgi:hypothetical protein